MLVPQLLAETLEDLLDEDLKSFKWFLSLKKDSCSWKPVPRSELQNISRKETVSLMIKSYGEESAVNITVEILKMMNFNGSAEELRKAYAGAVDV